MPHDTLRFDSRHTSTFKKIDFADSENNLIFTQGKVFVGDLVFSFIRLVSRLMSMVSRVFDFERKSMGQPRSCSDKIVANRCA